jgi:hypothetical protein
MHSAGIMVRLKAYPQACSYVFWGERRSCVFCSFDWIPLSFVGLQSSLDVGDRAFLLPDTGSRGACCDHAITAASHRGATASALDVGDEYVDVLRAMNANIGRLSSGT